jgi:hypothetical protein
LYKNDKVDDNLPLRKVALTSIETILGTLPERFDVNALLNIMPLLLSEKDEIKIQSHQVSKK